MRPLGTLLLVACMLALVARASAAPPPPPPDALALPIRFLATLGVSPATFDANKETVRNLAVDAANDTGFPAVAPRAQFNDVTGIPGNVSVVDVTGGHATCCVNVTKMKH